MKLTATLMLLAIAPAALANSVTICKQDKVMISAKSIEIVSQNHETVKLKHNCELKITPQSDVVVKNRGRTILEDQLVTILVDKQKNYCEVESIIRVT